MKLETLKSKEEKMKEVGQVKHQIIEDTHYLNLQKASPEAIESILDALNAEVDEAIFQHRFPSLEKVFGRFAFANPSLQ
jgi:hypothetical protein